MNEDESHGPGAVLAPPRVYLATLIAGLVIHFLFPVRFLPLGWIQLAAGLPLIFIGIVLWRSAGMTMVRAGTEVDVDMPATTVVVRGPFRLSRNPMYLAFTLLYLGIGTSANALWIVTLVPIPVAVISVQIVREERYLERTFGQEYLRYKARVRRWL